MTETGCSPRMDRLWSEPMQFIIPIESGHRTISYIGIVVALHGKETAAGDFMVEGISEADLPPQMTPPPSSGETDEDKFVVFVSGLSVGSSSANPLHFQLFVDHITGHLGDEQEQGIAAQILQVVIAGDSVELPRRLLSGQASILNSQTLEEVAKLEQALKSGQLPADLNIRVEYWRIPYESRGAKGFSTKS